MNGYVLNRSTTWAHAMKRSVGPGQKVNLSELYDQYGKKHGLEKGEEFVEWLKAVKLKDKSRWSVVFETIDTAESKPHTAEDLKESKTITTADDVTPKKMTVRDIPALSVRKAREVLPDINDVKLLKFSLQEATQMPNKDSLCRLLRKRISELEIAGFH